METLSLGAVKVRLVGTCNNVSSDADTEMSNG